MPPLKPPLLDVYVYTNYALGVFDQIPKCHGAGRLSLWCCDLALATTKEQAPQIERYFIHNHLAFTVKCHRDLSNDYARIVGFEVTPFSVKHEYEGIWVIDDSHPLYNFDCPHIDETLRKEIEIGCPAMTRMKLVVSIVLCVDVGNVPSEITLDWHFLCGTKEYKIRRQQFPHDATVFLEFEKNFQEAIEVTNKRMGVGMAKFSCKEVLLCFWVYHSIYTSKSNRKKSIKSSDAEKGLSSVKMVGMKGSDPQIDYKQTTKMTNNFEESIILGEGSFSCVYKTQLDDNFDVAIKKLHCEIDNEVDLLSKIQHPNIISLLGCGINGDMRFIVYELMLNGSLEAQLHDAGIMVEMLQLPTTGSSKCLDIVNSGKAAGSSEENVSLNKKTKDMLNTKYPMPYLQELGRCFVEILSGIYILASNLLSIFVVKLEEDCMDIIQQADENSKSATAQGSMLACKREKYVAVLHRKMIPRGSVQAAKVLIKWMTLPPKHGTCECSSLRTRMS